jgi:hypothetical protein
LSRRGGPILLHRCALVALAVAVLALVWVDAVSWRRTRGLRTKRKMGERLPEISAVSRSSPTTYLAACAGAALLATGLTSIDGVVWPSLCLAVAGLFVLVTGLAWRVRGFRYNGEVLVVRYAMRPSWVVPLGACRELRPPRLPVGGWRVRTADGGRTLMPSDLLGNEWVLTAIVARAGWSFDGRTWAPSASEGVSPGA